MRTIWIVVVLAACGEGVDTEGRVGSAWVSPERCPEGTVYEEVTEPAYYAAPVDVLTRRCVAERLPDGGVRLVGPYEQRWPGGAPAKEGCDPCGLDLRWDTAGLLLYAACLSDGPECTEPTYWVEEGYDEWSALDEAEIRARPCPSSCL